MKRARGAISLVETPPEVTTELTPPEPNGGGPGRKRLDSDHEEAPIMSFRTTGAREFLETDRSIVFRGVPEGGRDRAESARSAACPRATGQDLVRFLLHKTKRAIFSRYAHSGMDPYRHVVAFVLEYPWALTRPMLETVAEILARRIAGDRALDPDVEARLRSREKLPQPSAGGGGVAVVPVHGVLIPRGDLFSEMSGATSLESITANLREAAQSEAVAQIVLDVNSPGGSVAGATELAREILKVRAKKPVIAVANYTMASCAYWLGAMATEVVASPSAAVGSIGVYTIHDDLSKALEERGIRRTYIATSGKKVLGNETEPLSDEARAMFAKRIDEHYSRMTADISKGRGVSVEDVRKKYGEGATVGADEALSIGMIDRIETLDQTIARLSAAAPRSGAKAERVAGDTSQDSPRASTDQDRLSDARFRARFEQSVLELGLSL